MTDGGRIMTFKINQPWTTLDERSQMMDFAFQDTFSSKFCSQISRIGGAPPCKQEREQIKIIFSLPKKMLTNWRQNIEMSTSNVNIF